MPERPIEIPEIIRASRMRRGQSQDRFGVTYHVSGPAVFKYERGYITPTLKTWVKLAFDVGIAERDA